MTWVCVGKDHIVHQTRKHTYNEKSDNNTQSETQKRFRLVNIINTVQLLLSFTHDTGLLSTSRFETYATIINDKVKFCKC
jgi:hypothetical protein